MATFAKLHSTFWTDPANWEVLQFGAEAQSVALYLIGNAHHNMLWAYYLPLAYIANDTRLAPEKVLHALQQLCSINYCKYDTTYQYVWICNMALEQNSAGLDVKDNRTKSLQAIWKALPEGLSFLEDIYQKYHQAFHLEIRSFSKKKITDEKLEENFIENNETFLQENSLHFKESSKNNSKEKLEKNSQNSGEEKKGNFLTSFKPSFEGDSDTLQSSVQSPSQAIVLPFQDIPNIFQSILPPLAKVAEHPFEGCQATLQSSLVSPLEPIFTAPNCIKSEQNCEIFFPPKGVGDTFEGGVETLQSNIEYKIKNLELRIKKKEEDKEREENQTIVAPARPGDDASPIEENVSQEKILERTTEKNLALLTESDSSQTIEGNSLRTTEDMPRHTPANPADTLLPTKTSVVQKVQAKNQDVSDGNIAQVFEHWKNVMRHEKSNLDSKRRALIRNALQLGYDVTQLCQAITGCSYTPHNMGQNERGQRFDGLHIILRDADQIDRFIHNCHSPPKPFTKADQRLQANMQTMREWIQSKCKISEKSGEKESC